MANSYQTTLSALVKAEIAWTYENALPNSTTRDQDAARQTTPLSADHVDAMWHDRRTLAASEFDDLDLAGALENVFGKTFTIARLQGLLVRNLSTEPGADLQIGGAGAANDALAAWLGGDADATLTLRAGGVLLLVAPLDGYTVTAGSQDVLRVAHDGPPGEDIAYDVVLIGSTV